MKRRYFKRIANEDYYDISLRIKNNIGPKNWATYKEIETMVCDVTECKYNSANGKPKHWYDCLFNQKARNRGSLEFTKVVDEIGNAKRDEEGRPVMVCEKFIRRPD